MDTDGGGYQLLTHMWSPGNVSSLSSDEYNAYFYNGPSIWIHGNAQG